MHVLFLTLEFADPIFSGNGVWGRSLVRGLLLGNENLRITILCGRSSAISDAGGWPDANTGPWGDRLTIFEVPLARWGRLDRASSWDELASGALDALNKESNIKKRRTQEGSIEGALDDRFVSGSLDLVMGLDWHSLPVLEALDEVVTSLPFVFLNVRVFSSNAGLSNEDKSFYNDLESRCVARAARVIAQTQRDASVLFDLGSTTSTTVKATDVVALHCPLREDLRVLAADEPDTSAECQSDEVPGSVNRSYLLCVARLSPEKNVEAFVAAVEALGAEFESFGVKPLLVGAPSSPPEYGEELVRRMKAACPTAEYRGFGPPADLAQLYRATLLNFHGALSEPYGMSLVEAAAFGAPTILNEDGIGAAERLRASEGEAFSVAMEDPEAVANQLRALLADRPKLSAAGSRARDRAMAWSQTDFAAAVMSELQLATETCANKSRDAAF